MQAQSFSGAAAHPCGPAEEALHDETGHPLWRTQRGSAPPDHASATAEGTETRQNPVEFFLRAHAHAKRAPPMGAKKSGSNVLMLGSNLAGAERAGVFPCRT